MAAKKTVTKAEQKFVVNFYDEDGELQDGSYTFDTYDSAVEYAVASASLDNRGWSAEIEVQYPVAKIARPAPTITKL